MAATNPVPRKLVHSGTAQPLTLKAPITPPPLGGFDITVDGSAASKGWPTVPSTERMVITVGRGEVYETKYLISGVASTSTQSVLTVADDGIGYDGTTAQAAPAGATVEHTISATEMAQVNSHMRSLSQHGADGELVDQNSTQTLTNKTLTSPTISNPTISGGSIAVPGLRMVPVGAIMAWPSETIPTGWLKCDGSAFNAATYPELRAALGAAILPDLRDAYIKGGPVSLASQGSNNKQIAEANLPAHSHTGTTGAGSAHSHPVTGGVNDGGNHNHYYSGTTSWKDLDPHPLVTIQTYGTLQGGGARNVDGVGAGRLDPDHNHTYSGYTNDGGTHGHGHTLGTANESAHTHPFTTGQTGGGQPFNTEPLHVVMQFIICATSGA